MHGAMPTQKILLGDCLEVFANERNVPAFVSDPPANIGFMGRSWDQAHPALDFVLPGKPRSKAHERAWRRKEAFTRYWSVRHSMAYDIADQHAVNIVWALPRTRHQMAEAIERAGWTLKDDLIHLFGTGWMKSKRTDDDGERVPNAFAPGYENWIVGIKGKPDLDIDACRVPRGAGDDANRQRKSGATALFGAAGEPTQTGGAPGGSLPKNALLSHCEDCVRVGVKKAKASSIHGEATAVRGNSTHGQAGGHLTPGRTQRVSGFANEDGTESVPAWHCLAGCVCGARAVWDPEKPLPRCPCGDTWRWLCAVAEVNGQSGERTSGSILPHHVDSGSNNAALSGANMPRTGRTVIGDSGGASRFFNTFSYLSKCASGERHAGCESLFWKANKKNPFGFDQVTREEWESLNVAQSSSDGGTAFGRGVEARGIDARAQGNVHPTVKSYRLMHWLHSLTGAKRILDFTAGSGTGMLTAAIDGIEWLGAEICPEAITIAQARHAFWTGLSFQAREAFMRDDIVPQTSAANTLQQSLF